MTGVLVSSRLPSAVICSYLAELWNSRILVGSKDCVVVSIISLRAPKVYFSFRRQDKQKYTLHD